MKERRQERKNTGTGGEPRALRRRRGAAGALQGGQPGPERELGGRCVPGPAAPSSSSCRSARQARPPSAGNFPRRMPGTSGRCVPKQPRPLGQREAWAECSYSAQSNGMVFQNTISSRAPTPCPSASPEDAATPKQEQSLTLGVRWARGA